MDLSLDRASEIPLGIQLMWKLRTAIATGALGRGAKLPGIRELADAAAVNVNTVRSVLGRLQEQGLLLSEHGRGTFVSTAVRPDEMLVEARDAAIEQARLAGVDPQALAAALFISDGSARGPSDRAERAGRRALRAEIAELERELAKLDPLGSLDVRPSEAAPRLLSAGELAGVRDTLKARIRELRQEREEYRAQIAAEQAEQSQARDQRPRWRHAGVWTGGPAVQVSWTVP